MKKRLFAVAMALATLVALSGVAATAEEPGVERTFEFNQVDDIMNFTANAGTWSVSDGCLVQEARGSFYDYVYNEAMQQLNLSWKCAIEGSAGSSLFVGVAIGKQRPQDATGVSGYYIRLYGDGTLRVTDDHAARTLLEKTDVVDSATEMNEFRLVQNGKVYSLTINGGEALSFEDEEGFFASGFPGVVTNGPARFDTFAVAGVRVGGFEQCLGGTGVGGEYGREEQSGTVDIEGADEEYADRVKPDDGEEDPWFGNLIAGVNGGEFRAGESTVIPREKKNPAEIALWIVGGLCLAGAVGLGGWFLIKNSRGGKKDA